MKTIIFLFIVLYIYIFSLLNALFLMTPVFALNKLNKDTGFIFKNILYLSISFVLKHFLKIDVYVNSNELVKQMFDEQKQIFLIQNHFTEIDYLFQIYLFGNMRNMYRALSYKFANVAKKFVGNAFLGVGIHSMLSNDLYLIRDINIDNKVIGQKYDYDMIYMFPEGTCFNHETRLKSNNYVKQNNLVKFKYHLYPRLTGLLLLLKKNKNLRTIYDLTVVYDTIPKKIFGEKFKLQDFFYKFEYPSRVYINIQKYKIKELVVIQEQLEYIYTNKDNFVKNFNPNQNNFEIVKFNNFLTLSCFTIFNLIGLYSFNLLFNFGFVKKIYFLEIIFYLIYFNFFY
jgi:1-acyl-sn-glycerol-3-phosphate acyltransferase